MRIVVNVKANSKEDRIEKIDSFTYSARVKSPPSEGKANKSVINLLSSYFDVPKSSITIVKGFTSKTKVIDI